MKIRAGILFLILWNTVVYSQKDTLQSQYEVMYRIKSFSDTVARNNLTEENLSLLIRGNKSLFRSTQKVISDSIAMAIGNKAFENPVNGKVILDMKNVPGVYFKSEVFSDNGKQTIYKELMRNRFSFPLEDPIQWKIGNETKMIENYSCKKATGKYKGRHYVAWFTEAIPIPDGPYVFKGLPGLVLEVYDPSDNIHFTMVSFKKVVKPMTLMKDAFATKYSTFYKARQNSIDNAAGVLSNQTGITLKPADIARINSNAKRNNNYLD
jgi:GLPGLI family protein